MTSQKQDIDLGITRFEYGEESRHQRAVLEIETHKYYNGGLISAATVYWVGQHSRQNMISLGNDASSNDASSDYGKRLKISERTVRATQRNINKQHLEVFTPQVIEDLTRAAKERYASRVAAGKDAYGNVYPSEILAGGR